MVIAICGAPSQTSRFAHTTRVVGIVTKAIGGLKAGDAIGLRGPFGTGWPFNKAVGHDVILVAGGIGLAPLRPAIYDLVAHRTRYGRIILLYGTRSPEDLLYRRELEHWRGRFDLEVSVTVDRAISGWRGHVGVVTTLIRRAPVDSSNTVAMVCGPEVMMRFSSAELQKRGVLASNMFVSIERNMKCAVGFCGRCQLGPWFVCKSGPVLRYDAIAPWMDVREV